MDDRGFSFMEILVALLLSISISLALLKQQWQINRWRLQIQQQTQNWLQESNHREQGVSLLECMLALSLAIGLMMLLLQQYLQIKHQTDAMRQTVLQASRLQTVTALLRNSGHQAGFTPCLPIRYLHSYDHRSRHRLQALDLIQRDPFTLIFYRMASPFVGLTPGDQGNQFLLLEPIMLHPGQPVIIADCQHAEVFEAYQKGAHTIQFLQALHYAYHAPIYFGEWLQESFSVTVNKRGEYALLYQQNQHGDELLTNLSAMSGDLEMSNPKHLHLKLGLRQGHQIPLTIRLEHA